MTYQRNEAPEPLATSDCTGTLKQAPDGSLRCELCGWTVDTTTHKQTRSQRPADTASEALRQIDEWAKAYPLDVFPEPDLKRAHEVLEAAGLSLGQISAHAMRHVLTGLQKIAAQTKP